MGNRLTNTTVAQGEALATTNLNLSYPQPSRAAASALALRRLSIMPAVRCL